jgi:hypothetical protein
VKPEHGRAFAARAATFKPVTPAEAARRLRPLCYCGLRFNDEEQLAQHTAEVHEPRRLRDADRRMRGGELDGDDLIERQRAAGWPI